MSIASPCTNICRISAASGYCEGCFRTLDEIAHWGGYDETKRERIMSAVEQRRSASACRSAVTLGAGVRS